jgi:hypothetical protein
VIFTEEYSRLIAPPLHALTSSGPDTDATSTLTDRPTALSNNWRLDIHIGLFHLPSERGGTNLVRFKEAQQIQVAKVVGAGSNEVWGGR